MAKSKILIVDDEVSMREFLEIMLSKEGYKVSSSGSGKEALKMLNDTIYDLIVSDVQMPGMNGIELLRNVKEVCPDTTVIMITAYASTESGVEAMKAGAYDYITKPFKVDEIKLIIKNALEKKRLEVENLLLKREFRERYS
ncbi:MAG: response regulator, partial [Deltaproteobacteria bacterium]